MLELGTSGITEYILVRNICVGMYTVGGYLWTTSVRIVHFELMLTFQSILVGHQNFTQSFHKGLNKKEIEKLADSSANHYKVSRRDLSFVLSQVISL